MAYPRPYHDGRSPTELEHKRAPWDPIPRPHYSTMPPVAPPPPPLLSHSSSFDPESEDSDVSITPGDNNFIAAQPLGLPLLAKHGLESSDAIQAHLNELSRIEDQNIKKHKRLMEKRARKDDKIRVKREAQDAKIRAIMDARARRDGRIERRRKQEDAAFQRFYDDLEDEENRFRHRLKRLKRGLPVDDSTAGGRSMSSASMSPPAPAYSTIPPPAKRHQTGPPGHNDSPIMNTPRDHRPYPPTAPNVPSYSFYQSGQSQQSPYSVPYHSAPGYNSSPQQNPAGTPLPPLRTAPPVEPVAISVNGQPASPQPGHLPQPASNMVPTSLPPPRQISAQYDTRPPPPSVSGFATINHPPPPQTGFAAINSRTTGTPPPHAALAKEGAPGSLPRPTEYTPSRPFVADAAHNGSLPAMGSGNKRTPSTTHPYQMSEAFANRHHHCEKTDSLNRGIWTWYGPGGTQDNPTGPPTEMYLKCNHDGCGRIDWRTVHGLQCHIVKNHEQPKGTIGSLEKALEKYGVPVKEIEDIEKREGLGAGGTMADPKNLKMKTKTREAGEKRDGDRRSTPASSGPTPTSFRANSSTSHDSPSQSTHAGKPFGPHPGLRHEDSNSSATDGTPSEIKNRPPVPATGGFAAVNSTWPGNHLTPSKQSETPDQEMRDATVSKPRPSTETPASKSPSNKSFWPSWQETPEVSKNASHPQSSPLSTSQHKRAASGGWSADILAKSQKPPPEAKMNGQELQSSSTQILNPPTNSELPQSRPESTSKENHNKETEKVTEVVEVQNVDVEMGGVEQLQMKQSETTSDKDTQMVGGSEAKVVPQDSAKPEEEEPPRPPLSTSDGSRSAVQSPEMSNKRMGIGSRRGSRRSSMAATASKTASERDRDDVIDESVEIDKDGDSAQEDDENTITVGGSSIAEKSKDKDAPETKRTRQGRQSNGRFVRKTRQN